MIEVNISESSGSVKIELTGHSGYGKKGEDIVCAGISGVVQFLIVHLFNNLGKKGKFELSSGKGLIEIPKERDTSPLISSLIEYLKLVEKSYPGSVCLRFLSNE
ncbi:MAG: ribosomal-processing cysteine protease Prp [Brevinematia bacterium]